MRPKGHYPCGLVCSAVGRRFENSAEISQFEKYTFASFIWVGNQPDFYDHYDGYDF